MSVAITSASPTTFSAAGGSITITGTFPDAESPFTIELATTDTFEWADYIAVDVTSPDQVTLSATIPADLPGGSYTIWVFESANPGNVAGLAGLTLTGAPAALPGVDSVAPDTVTTDGGTITVTGVFEGDTDYWGVLRVDGDTLIELSDGDAVRTTDGTTLAFTVPEGAAEGAYELYVYSLVDLVPNDLPGSASLEIELGARPVYDAARSSATLLSEVERFRPEYYCGALPLSAGFAAAVGLAEAAYDDLREQATIGLGAERWLTLQAHGQGILRASGETDESLRLRMRSVDDAVTKPAIKAAVDALVSPDECEILEWFDHGFLDVELEGEHGMWLDTERLPGLSPSFLVVVPEQGWISAGPFLDADCWLDSAYLGTETETPAYLAIINAVERARAAGVGWRLCLAA